MRPGGVRGERIIQEARRVKQDAGARKIVETIKACVGVCSFRLVQAKNDKSGGLVVVVGGIGGGISGGDKQEVPRARFGAGGRRRAGFCFWGCKTAWQKNTQGTPG